MSGLKDHNGEQIRQLLDGAMQGQGGIRNLRGEPAIPGLVDEDGMSMSIKKMDEYKARGIDPRMYQTRWLNPKLYSKLPKDWDDQDIERNLRSRPGYGLPARQ